MKGVLRSPALRFTFLIGVGTLISVRAASANERQDPANAEPKSSSMPSSTGDRAKQLIVSLANGRFAEVAREFGDRLKASLTSEDLQRGWQDMERRFGSFRDIVTTRSIAPVGVVVAETRFGDTKVMVIVRFGSDGRVEGLALQSPRDEIPPATPPSYADTALFSEREVTVGSSGAWPLPGTLSLPRSKGLHPAVVLVHGSGPADRDESLGPNRPFRDIAWGLASRGIAVLRYDKRTKVHTSTFSRLTVYTVQQETIEDALAAVALLKSVPEIDQSRIVVLGHSLGAMLAPRIAVQDTTIAGIVVMAGPNRPLEDALLEQAVYVDSIADAPMPYRKEMLDSLRAQVDRVRDTALSENTPPTLLPGNVPASYWLDLRHYVAASAAKGIHRPFLILQGGRDFNVTMADYRIWQQQLSDRSDVQFKLYPDLNHLFMTGTGRSTPIELMHPGNVATDVVADISDWITGLGQRSRD